MSIDELIDNFSFLDSWEDRYKYLIELGTQLPHISDELKTEEWKVPGCQSQVWIIPHYEESRIYLRATVTLSLFAELLPLFWKFLKINLHKKF